jgi:hypothetical protein
MFSAKSIFYESHVLKWLHFILILYLFYSRVVSRTKEYQLSLSSMDVAKATKRLTSLR